MLHLLKINSRHLRRIISGHKTFEIRLNDRDYQVGDCIYFSCIDDEPNYMTGKFNPNCDWRINYILSGFGLKEGYVALSLFPLKHYEEYSPLTKH